MVAVTPHNQNVGRLGKIVHREAVPLTRSREARRMATDWRITAPTPYNNDMSDDVLPSCNLNAVVLYVKSSGVGRPRQ